MHFMLFFMLAVIPTFAFGDVESRINFLLSRLTLVEKIKLVTGDDPITQPIPRLGIPSIVMNDGPLGLRLGRTTAFPAGVALAASFHPELAREMGIAMADEARLKGVNMLLGPTVNISRSPLGGRNFESFGEDPLLTSLITREYILGVQSRDVIATVKHFAVNDQETERKTVDVRVDLRTLFEIHLPAFKAAVDAGVWSVMAAYNKVNGDWATENKFLLTDVLKKLWGFQGFVVSDWVSTHSTEKAANAGLDLEMPTGDVFGEHLLSAVKEGEVSPTVLDDKVRRILRSMFGIGLLRDGHRRKLPVALGPESREHRAIAQRIAEEGSVLLKNEHILPLDKHLTSIAVIGPHAAKLRTGGGGSSHVIPYESVSPLEALKKKLGPRVNITYATGTEIDGDERDPIAAEFWQGLQASYYKSVTLEGAPYKVKRVSTLELNVHGHVPYGVRWKGILLPPVTGEYRFSSNKFHNTRVLLDGKEILKTTTDDDEVIQEVSIPLIGKQKYQVVVESSHTADDGQEPLSFGWDIPDENLEARAVAAAKSSDVALIFLGLGNEMESEGGDRDALELPEDQVELLDAVASVNPNVVVVLSSGTPIAMGAWLHKVKAVLHSWYPGSEGGNAIARILTGDVNPSGKLPVSFVRRFEDSSAYGNFPGTNGAVDYKEGIFVGYRFLDRYHLEPEFPFGFGLSYTTFKLSNLKVVTLDDRVSTPYFKVQVDVENVGAVRGAEVIQVYVGETLSKLPRPERELKAFRRVELDPGKSVTVELQLDRSAFSYFDPETFSWAVDPHEFTVSVGTSSRDLPFVRRIQLK